MRKSVEKAPSNRFAFTQAKVRSLQLQDGTIQNEYWDTETRRFGLRVSAKTKSFFILTRCAGVMTRVKVGVFPEMSVDDARKKAAKLLVDMADGINPNAVKKQALIERGKTLEELFKMKMATPKGQKLKATTRVFYEQTFKNHLAAWGKKLVKDITLQEATALHAAIGKHSTYSANAAIKILRGVLSFQESMDITYRNPLRFYGDAVGMFEESTRKNFIEELALPAWYQAVNNLNNVSARDYLLLLLFTGLRRNEGMGLRWQDINFDKSVITIPDTKNGKVLYLPIPSALFPILKDRWSIYGAGMYVFPSAGKSGHINSVQYVVKELVETPGVSDFQLHDIRRTFANAAVKIGVPYQIVKWLLNHRSKGDVTDNHYVTHDIEFLRAPMEQIGAELLRMATAKVA